MMSALFDQLSGREKAKREKDEAEKLYVEERKETCEQRAANREAHRLFVHTEKKKKHRKTLQDFTPLHDDIINVTVDYIVGDFETKA